MNLNGHDRIQLVRLLEGTLDEAESSRMKELLRRSPEARAFVRELSEQAVMLADIERTQASRRLVVGATSTRHAEQQRSAPLVADFRRWWPMAAAAVLVLISGLVIWWNTARQRGVVEVVKATGSSQYFGANGKVVDVLGTGASLGVGDTFETRSCDAWVELKLRDGGSLTIGGHSSVRILESAEGAQRFKLLRGSLWINPGSGRQQAPIFLQTSTMSAEARGAQFDLQASPSESQFRVNKGSARVKQHMDGSTVELKPGQQVAVSLIKRGALEAVPQPRPVDAWACDMWSMPEVLVGRWLPEQGGEKVRLGVEPLLWPVSKTDSVMLYAVSVAAWKNTDNPVQLRQNSVLRYRGRISRPQAVRFGFTAQKMRGTFAGKFNIKIEPDQLGPVGSTWQVDLPLHDFKPQYPQLAATPDGLELTDVYAFTVNEDAGLEINHIELVPGK